MAYPEKRVRISKRMLDIENNLYYYLFLIKTTENKELENFEDYTKVLQEIIFSLKKAYRLQEKGLLERKWDQRRG